MTGLYRFLQKDSQIPNRGFNFYNLVFRGQGWVGWTRRSPKQASSSDGGPSEVSVSRDSSPFVLRVPGLFTQRERCLVRFCHSSSFEIKVTVSFAKPRIVCLHQHLMSSRYTFRLWVFRRFQGPTVFPSDSSDLGTFPFPTSDGPTEGEEKTIIVRKDSLWEKLNSWLVRQTLHPTRLSPPYSRTSLKTCLLRLREERGTSPPTLPWLNTVIEPLGSPSRTPTGIRTGD